MIPLILGIAGCLCIVALAFIGRPKRPWPNEGHGQTYFMRPTSQNW